jgi:hypothetical protein
MAYLGEHVAFLQQVMGDGFHSQELNSEVHYCQVCLLIVSHEVCHNRLVVVYEDLEVENK